MTTGQWARKYRAASIVVALALCVGGVIGMLLHHSLLLNKREAARELAFMHAQRIETRIQEAVGPAYMLASLVRYSGDRLGAFDAVGEELLLSFPLARAVELAPRGVVTQVYPLSGNQSAVGHDLLKDRDRNQEAYLAVARRQLTVAGPVELVQGGLGVIARYPIFMPEPGGRESFWGFSIVLIRVAELLNASGMIDIARDGYRYELCRIPPNGVDCVVFSPEGGGHQLVEPVTVAVEVPNGRWQLSVSPEGGWVSISEKLLVLGVVLAVTGSLIGVLCAFLRSLRRGV